MKKILGLDLGTNSIGAALINIPESFDDFGKEGNIEWIGSRIIPMDGYVSSKTGKAFKENPFDSFSKGVGISKAASRRIKRGSRRLKQRYILRRTRLIQTFKVLGWLNENFPENFKKQMNINENFSFRISDYLPFENSTIEEATKLLGVENKKGELVLPEDWIVYYLRKKALTEKISIAELCRITYMMNQRRGFKSSRKDLKEENVEEKKWVEKLKIKSVKQVTTELNKNRNYKFEITCYNENIKSWTVEKKKKPEWEGKEFTFLITEKIETKNDGTKKITQNNPQIPKEDDWALCVTAQDNQIGEEYPGTYFFNGLMNSVKNKTDFKIRQYAVYRKKYKKELEDIWNKQIELNEDLEILNTDKEILKKIASKLYKTQTLANKPKLNEILSNTLLHLISNDIIYYQRDLKSQKSSRGECQYESHKGKDINGVRESYGVKCAPKSSPEFQEMRMWQDVHNIKILLKETIDENGFTKVDIDVTQNFIDENIKEKLFDLFDREKVITQQNIFNEINKHKSDIKLNADYRINMFFDGKVELKGNETKEYFRRIFKKCNYEIEGEKILSDIEKFYKLWNISYSISLNDQEKSKEAIFKALKKTENKKGKAKEIFFDFPDNVAKAIAAAPDIEATKKYGSYSSKAIRKLLPLMRCGNKYFVSIENQIASLSKQLENVENENKKKKIEHEKKRINEVVKRANQISKRLEHINHNPKRIHEIADDDVQKQLLKSFIGKKDLLKDLNTYQACYLVYDRHSERVDERKYSEPSDFNIMEKLPNNSLRNPIVEQVIREVLFLVKDVWSAYGQPDEIHIEMGRDLKKNAKQRKSASEKSTNNFEKKKRIKELLYELMNGFEQYENVDDVSLNSKIVSAKFEVKPNPNNPNDIDRFRIWKDTSGLKDFEFEKKVKDEKIPKNQEIKKYALWLSQKCVSPYTGRIIPLSKLFDQSQYEIEHVLPKSKIKNDSFDNLVISERGVNKAKGGELAAIFIKSKNGGCEYEGKKYELQDYDSYVAHCKNTFRGKKLQNLLATEIPDDFISRQINDTRYITKKISELLYPVAKDKDACIVFTIGAITSELKREWGLQKEWKKIIKPRFERLEKINNATYIIPNLKDRNDIDFHIPENLDLDTKRIDHRHHALDAIIIAATTREHIRYLNSLNAVDTDEELKKVKHTLVKGKIREFHLPWQLFTKEAKEKLEQTIVTFKTYNKVIDKPKNVYKKWKPILDSKGEQIYTDSKNKLPLYEHSRAKQTKPENGKLWASIRQSLFAEQPHGKVYIKEVIEKSFETPRQMLDVMKIEIGRVKAQNTSLQKTASYIYDKEARTIVKQMVEQIKGDDDEILKQLKKIKPNNLRGEAIKKVRIAVFNPYAAKRKEISRDFDHKVIDKIPYADKEKSKIPNALHNHLLEYEEKKLGIEKLAWRNQRLVQLNNDVKYEVVVLNEVNKKLIKEAQSEAFSDEGIEVLDKKIGMKIRMVTLMEDVGIKIPLKNKYSEADGNPYFVMYENIKTKTRNDFKHESLSSYQVIEKRRKGLPIADEIEGYKTIILQTNDLVYVPTKAEFENMKNGFEAIDWDNKKEIQKRLYIVNDFSKSDIYFKPNQFSKAIKSKELHSSFDDKCSRLIITPKIDNIGNDITEEAVMIKEVCIKVKVDRIGNIKIR